MMSLWYYEKISNAKRLGAFMPSCRTKKGGKTVEYQLTEPARTLKVSAVRELLKLTQTDAVISFAGGLPAEDFFPAEALKQAFERVFTTGNKALQYGLTEGYTPLREQIGHRLARRDIHVAPDEILLTTGSQQAIDLVAKVYLEPGSVILTENPTYLVALQAFRYYSVQIVPVLSDEQGMDPEDLRAKIEQYHPKLVYVIPTFANPTGWIWETSRRMNLIEECDRHNVLIVEDDPYGEIKFTPDEHYPSLMSLAQQSGKDCVVYTSTFSKTVVPALRIGWICGARALITAMVRAKQGADLHSSSLDQQALFQLLDQYDLDAHIGTIADEYQRRMRLMITLLEQQNLEGAHWTEPKGGMFLWLELAQDLDAEVVLKQSLQEGVAFVPGTEFYVGSPQKNTLRLNFSHTGREKMTAGVERLGRAIHECVSSVR